MSAIGRTATPTLWCCAPEWRDLGREEEEEESEGANTMLEYDIEEATILLTKNHWQHGNWRMSYQPDYNNGG